MVGKMDLTAHGTAIYNIIGSLPDETELLIYADWLEDFPNELGPLFATYIRQLVNGEFVEVPEKIENLLLFWRLDNPYRSVPIKAKAGWKDRKSVVLENPPEYINDKPVSNSTYLLVGMDVEYLIDFQTGEWLKVEEWSPVRIEGVPIELKEVPKECIFCAFITFLEHINAKNSKRHN